MRRTASRGAAKRSKTPQNGWLASTTPVPRPAPPVPAPFDQSNTAPATAQLPTSYRSTPCHSDSEELDFSIASLTPRRTLGGDHSTGSTHSPKSGTPVDLRTKLSTPSKSLSRSSTGLSVRQNLDDLGVGWSHTLPLPVRCVEMVAGHAWVCDRSGALSLRTDDGQLVKSIETRTAHTPDSFVTCLLAVSQTVWAGYSKPQLRVFDAQTGNHLHTITSHHSGAIHCLAQKDGFVYSGGADFRICQWDAHSWEYCKQFMGHTTGVRVILPDDDLLYTGGDDCVVRVWQQAIGEQVVQLSGHQKGVKCLVRTTEHLWSGAEDFSIRVWRIGDWACVRVLDSHLGPVTSLAVVGDRVWSGSKDGIKLWSVSSLRLLGEYNKQESYVTSIRVTRRFEECRVWTIASDNTVAVWDTRVDLPTTEARAVVSTAAAPPKEAFVEAFYTVRRNLEERVAVAQREREEAVRQRDEARARCAQLEAQNQLLEAAKEDADAQAKQAQEASLRLQEAMHEQIRQREQVSYRATGTASALLMEKEQELGEMRKQVSKWKDEVFETTQRCEAMQRQIASLQTELKKKEERATLLQRVQDANDGTIKDFNQKFQQALAIKSALENALREKDQQLQQAQAEQSGFSTYLKEREERLLQVQQLVEQLQDEKAAHQEELQSVHQHHQFYEQERARFEAELQSLHSQVERAQTSAYHMSVLLRGQQEKIQELEEFRTNHLPVPPQHRDFVVKTRGAFVRRVVGLLDPLGQIERISFNLSKEFQRYLIPLGRIAREADVPPSSAKSSGGSSDAPLANRTFIHELGIVHEAAEASCEVVLTLYELARSTLATVRVVLDSFLTDSEKLSNGVTVKRAEPQVNRDAEKLADLLRQAEGSATKPREPTLWL
eukprot:TRINITY_DN5381_c0_g1_i3.p1 TRINITY_DN5381_c0_g1~~TRINITY_DN5381_c0_g1_i3.p1  ORF type:complete len:895 (-),score=168.22 TRINITY_DN5381_c0_g1_i3:157-2817(-)